MATERDLKIAEAVQKACAEAVGHQYCTDCAEAIDLAAIIATIQPEPVGVPEGWRDLATSALQFIQANSEHAHLCDIFDLDDEGRHKDCTCGLDAIFIRHRAMLAAAPQVGPAPALPDLNTQIVVSLRRVADENPFCSVGHFLEHIAPGAPQPERPAQAAEKRGKLVFFSNPDTTAFTEMFENAMATGPWVAAIGDIWKEHALTDADIDEVIGGLALEHKWDRWNLCQLRALARAIEDKLKGGGS